MRPQEIELWTNNVIDVVLNGKKCEDFRVELKCKWEEPIKAARHLAGQANAAGGSPILLLIGVDEKANRLCKFDDKDIANWYSSVKSRFNGNPPDLLYETRLNLDSGQVVVLYFETDKAAPYVIKNDQQGGPDFEVPWREGTSTRTANRTQLLRILVPIVRLTGLVAELEFNFSIAEKAGAERFRMGICRFREKEFHKALRDGSIDTLEAEIRTKIFNAYIAIGSANQAISTATRNPLAGVYRDKFPTDATASVTKAATILREAIDALQPMINNLKQL